MNTPVDPVEVDTLPGLSSDVTEPYIMRTIGILWQRFERSEKLLCDYRILWDSVRALNLLATVACNGKTGLHASLACNNALDKLRTYIKLEAGIVL